MIRGVWFADGIDTDWMVEAVLNGVPASDRHVLPAAEGNRIVHHDNLLVMRRADRQIIIQAVANSAGLRTCKKATHWSVGHLRREHPR
jgi:hypothetical protein